MAVEDVFCLLHLEWPCNKLLCCLRDFTNSGEVCSWVIGSPLDLSSLVLSTFWLGSQHEVTTAFFAMFLKGIFANGLALCVGCLDGVTQGATEKHCHSTEEDFTVSIPVDNAMQCCMTNCICKSFAINFDRVDGSFVVSNQVLQEDNTAPCCHVSVTKDFVVWLRRSCMCNEHANCKELSTKRSQPQHWRSNDDPCSQAFSIGRSR